MDSSAYLYSETSSVQTSHGFNSPEWIHPEYLTAPNKAAKSHGFNSPEWIHRKDELPSVLIYGRTALTALNGFILIGVTQVLGQLESHGFNSPEWIHPHSLASSTAPTKVARL